MSTSKAMAEKGLRYQEPTIALAKKIPWPHIANACRRISPASIVSMILAFGNLKSRLSIINFYPFYYIKLSEMSSSLTLCLKCNKSK